MYTFVTSDGREYTNASSEKLAELLRDGKITETEQRQIEFDGVKTMHLCTLKQEFDAALGRLWSKYPSLMPLTFVGQRTEAKAWSNDNNYSSVLLSAMATAEQSDVSDVVARILHTSEAYEEKVGHILGHWNAISRQLEGMSHTTHSINDIHAVAWEVK